MSHIQAAAEEIERSVGDATIMRISPKDGSLGIDARALGQSIEAYAKAMEAVARDLGELVCVYVVDLKKDGDAFEVEFVVAAKPRKATP